jgi:threonyl-tRNA synthetase
MLVVGDKERDAGQVAVRSRRGEDMGSMPLEDFIALAEKEVADKVI